MLWVNKTVGETLVSKGRLLRSKSVLLKKTCESLKNFDKESKLSFEATIPFGLLHFDKISTSTN